jgi:hypothetical protein
MSPTRAPANSASVHCAFTGTVGLDPPKRTTPRRRRHGPSNLQLRALPLTLRRRVKKRSPHRHAELRCRACSLLAAVTGRPPRLDHRTGGCASSLEFGPRKEIPFFAGQPCPRRRAHPRCWKGGCVSVKPGSRECRSPHAPGGPPDCACRTRPRSRPGVRRPTRVDAANPLNCTSRWARKASCGN